MVHIDLTLVSHWSHIDLTLCFHRFLPKIIEQPCVFIDFCAKSLKFIEKSLCFHRFLLEIIEQHRVFIGFCSTYSKNLAFSLISATERTVTQRDTPGRSRSGIQRDAAGRSGTQRDAAGRSGTHRDAPGRGGTWRDAAGRGGARPGRVWGGARPRRIDLKLVAHWFHIVFFNI